MNAGPDGGIPAEKVRATIDEILSRPEFQEQSAFFQHWLDNVVDWVKRVLSEFFGISLHSAGTLFAYLVYGGLGIALGWIVWRIIVLRRRRAATAESASAALDPQAVRHERVVDLRRRARSARSAGENVLALRLYFTAMVIGLGERGDLEYRDAWTNRELLERGEPNAIAERALAPLVPPLDRKSFGGEVATDEDVRAMAGLVDDLLGTEVA